PEQSVGEVSLVPTVGQLRADLAQELTGLVVATNIHEEHGRHSGWGQADQADLRGILHRQRPLDFRPVDTVTDEEFGHSTVGKGFSQEMPAVAICKSRERL